MKIKYLVTKAVASYKFGQVIEFEEDKLPLALSAHVVLAPEVEEDESSNDIKSLKKDVASLKKEVKTLSENEAAMSTENEELKSKIAELESENEELKTAPSLELEVATPDSKK